MLDGIFTSYYTNNDNKLNTYYYDSYYISNSSICLIYKNNNNIILLDYINFNFSLFNFVLINKVNNNKFIIKFTINYTYLFNGLLHNSLSIKSKDYLFDIISSNIKIEQAKYTDLLKSQATSNIVNSLNDYKNILFDKLDLINNHTTNNFINTETYIYNNIEHDYFINFDLVDKKLTLNLNKTKLNYNNINLNNLLLINSNVNLTHSRNLLFDDYIYKYYNNITVKPIIYIKDNYFHTNITLLIYNQELLDFYLVKFKSRNLNFLTITNSGNFLYHKSNSYDKPVLIRYLSYKFLTKNNIDIILTNNANLLVYYNILYENNYLDYLNEHEDFFCNLYDEYSSNLSAKFDNLSSNKYLAKYQNKKLKNSKIFLFNCYFKYIIVDNINLTSSNSFIKNIIKYSLFANNFIFLYNSKCQVVKYLYKFKTYFKNYTPKIFNLNFDYNNIFNNPSLNYILINNILNLNFNYIHSDIFKNIEIKSVFNKTTSFSWIKDLIINQDFYNDITDTKCYKLPTLFLYYPNYKFHKLIKHFTFINNLEDSIVNKHLIIDHNCPVCQDNLHHNIIIQSCGHFICYQCYYNLQLNALFKKTNNYLYNCCVCKASITPKKNVILYNDNIYNKTELIYGYYISKLLSILKAINNEYKNKTENINISIFIEDTKYTIDLIDLPFNIKNYLFNIIVSNITFSKNIQYTLYTEYKPDDLEHNNNINSSNIIILFFNDHYNIYSYKDSIINSLKLNSIHENILVYK